MLFQLFKYVILSFTLLKVAWTKPKLLQAGHIVLSVESCGISVRVVYVVRRINKSQWVPNSLKRKLIFLGYISLRLVHMQIVFSLFVMYASSELTLQQSRTRLSLARPMCLPVFPQSMLACKKPTNIPIFAQTSESNLSDILMFILSLMAALQLGPHTHTTNSIDPHLG